MQPSADSASLLGIARNDVLARPQQTVREAAARLDSRIRVRRFVVEIRYNGVDG